MTLITRVSRLFQADLHAVLDRVEEPDILLKQAVREMEMELDRDAHHIKRLTHEQGQLKSRERDIDQSLLDMEEELDVCFSSDKNDLARTLIRRKLEAQRFKKHLSRKHQTLQETLVGLNKRFEENRLQLDGMRQKAELISEERDSNHINDTWNVADISVRDEDVEVAFLREVQRRKRQ